MSIVLGSYDYADTGRGSYNRRIEFSRDGWQQDSIKADVYTLEPNGSLEEKISTITGRWIVSTDPDAKEMLYDFEQHPERLYGRYAPLSTFRPDQQLLLIGSLDERKVCVFSVKGKKTGPAIPKMLTICGHRQPMCGCLQ